MLRQLVSGDCGRKVEGFNLPHLVQSLLYGELATSGNGRMRPLLRQCSLGCLLKSRGLFQCQAPGNWSAWRKTLEPSLSNLRSTISVRSIAPPQRSRCKGLGTPRKPGANDRSLRGKNVFSGCIPELTDPARALGVSVTFEPGARTA